MRQEESRRNDRHSSRVKRAAGVRELMDDPVDALDELEGNLRDIARTNRWLGGIGPVRRAVRRSGARTLLDVGSGLGDVAEAIARDAARAGAPLHVTCLDRSEQMVALARQRFGRSGRLTFVVGDARALPFPDGSFDAVVCALALHHFEPDDARMMLRELRRVARRTPIVCDLVRSRAGFIGTWLVTRLTRNRLTRHDAPLSVRRAYTPAEALALARDAGWRAPQVWNEPFFRMTLIDA